MSSKEHREKLLNSEKKHGIGSRVKVKKRGVSNATKITTASKAEQKHHRTVMREAIKVDYEAGLLTRGQIVDKYGIWRSTLNGYVNAGDWEYARKREAALANVHTRMINKYSDLRATISDQHLDELNGLKEKVLQSDSKTEVDLWAAKAETVMKIIKSERIALAMPNEYKYIEQKNENVFRVEDALKELAVISPSSRVEDVIEGELVKDELTTPITKTNESPASQDAG
jgi:hypothetical protein